MSQSYMYYPMGYSHMYPNFYHGNGYYNSQPGELETEGESTGGVEHIAEGRKLDQSELSKAEALETAFNEQKAEMA